MTLEQLGWTAQVWAAFAGRAARQLVAARVAFSDGERCRLLVPEGDWQAHVAGTLLGRSRRADLPVVGDWVAVRPIAASEAIVEAVLPRRTRFSRRAAGPREEEQVLAANIDLVFLVCGLDGDFNPRRLERYLTLTWESGARPVVVLNKLDLCADPEARKREAVEVARGAPVIAASAVSGDVAALRNAIAPQQTVALLGSSGVGKSTIVNALVGEPRQSTAEVRASDSRGRHTTTARELIPLAAGGLLIDSPGMRELQLWATEESVERTFDEIAEAARACRFRDCRHEGDAGCAVAAALADGRIDAARWQSYRKQIGEVRRHERLADVCASLEEKRRWKHIHKAQRRFYRDRQ